MVTHETEPLSICSKSTMETELQVKFVQSSQQRQKKEVIDVVQVSLLLTWNIFHTLFWSLHCWLWTSKCWLESKLRRQLIKIADIVVIFHRLILSVAKVWVTLFTTRCFMNELFQSWFTTERIALWKKERNTIIVKLTLKS